MNKILFIMIFCEIIINLKFLYLKLINNNRCNLAKQTLVVIKHKKYNKHLQNYVINVKN